MKIKNVEYGPDVHPVLDGLFPKEAGLCTVSGTPYHPLLVDVKCHDHVVPGQ